MKSITLATNLMKIHHTNPMNAQKAGSIDFWIVLLCKNSQIKAHPNGHKINPIGQKNIHTIIHIKHHQFHHLVQPNFLVHSIGK